MLHSGRDDFLQLIKTVLLKELPNEKVEKICYQLSDIAGGELVYISKLHQDRLSVRNKLIKQDRDSGFTISRLATKYLLSEKQIMRVIRQ